MSASTAKGARRVLINFSSGPIHCRSCGAVMRPSKGITNGWPASTVPYGRAGECRSCVTPATAEAGHADEAETATAVEQPLSPTKAAPTPNAVPRRRPRHRFDYRPPHWRVPVLRLTRQGDLHVHFHRRGHQRS